jgi:uncharacterized protein (DUF362 family)
VSRESGVPAIYSGAGCSSAEFFRQLADRWPQIWPEPEAPGKNLSARILVKINLNTADSFPAATDAGMLRELLLFLQQQGFSRLRVGDCSSISAVPTRKVADKAGILAAVDGLAEFVAFDEQPWLKLESGLPHLPAVTVPQAVAETDFLLHLANMKTHSLADFSFGLKLGIGYMHPLERYALHKGSLQEKVAEMASLIVPDLTIVDGRQAFVCGGPITGRVEPAAVILAGRNSLAVDVEAYRQLYRLKQALGCEEGFVADPFAMRQLAEARRLGIGGLPWQEYELIEI